MLNKAHIQIFIGCLYPEKALRGGDGGQEHGVSGSLHACMEADLILLHMADPGHFPAIIKELWVILILLFVCCCFFFLFCSFSLSNWGTQSTRQHGNWRTETHLTVLSGIWTGIINISVIMRSHDALNICPFSKKRSLWYFVALSFA